MGGVDWAESFFVASFKAFPTGIARTLRSGLLALLLGTRTLLGAKGIATRSDRTLPGGENTVCFFPVVLLDLSFLFLR